MSLYFYIEEEDNNKEVTLNNYKDLFLEYEINLPTLTEALNQMFQSKNLDNNKVNELTNDILDKCKIKMDLKFDEIKKKYNNISKDDAYIICSYTCESKEKKYSPYRILNQNLVSENRKNGVENISKYLYIFLKSLRKLPRYYPIKPNKYLYRCISHKVNLAKDPFNDKLIPYINGNKKIFWGFTSTSSNPKSTYNFLEKDDNLKVGTIFLLGGDVWRYDIQLFNYYGEKEILLEPERKFIVESVLPPLNEIINVICNILNTPLILDNIGLEKNIIKNNIIEDKEKEDHNYYSEIKEYIVKIDTEIIINEELKYNITGIGILCNINIKHINVLITYSNIIDFELLNEIEKLRIIINNEEKVRDMKINRYKYTNEDITIIEILNEDNINNFIEIDKFIYSKDYINNDIICICIYLTEDEKLEIIKDKIKLKNNDNYICSIEGIKIGIIILEENLKLIGIIKDNKNKIEIIPMNIIINKINFIECKYEIKKDDIGKEIQIISGKDSDGEFVNTEIIKEIKILINGEIKYINI